MGTGQPFFGQPALILQTLIQVKLPQSTSSFPGQSNGMNAFSFVVDGNAKPTALVFTRMECVVGMKDAFRESRIRPCWPWASALYSHGWDLVEFQHSLRMRCLS